MPIPPFVVELRRHIGRQPLWLIGVTAVVLRRLDAGGTTGGDPQAADGDDETEVLLVRRADTGEWAPVSGIVDPGEDPHVCAVREVAEETCVEVQVERMVWMCAGDLVEHQNGDQCWYLDHTFRCHWVRGEPAVGDDESLEVAWWPSRALPPMRAHYADRVACALADEPETRLGPLAVPVEAAVAPASPTAAAGPTRPRTA